tara:strand:- start:70 stop:273 length:204 start_codon:yes stop_codon:yes gene_type:complete
MRAGDLVRFRECTWHVEPKRYTDWKIGLLLEYNTWSKMGTILFEGGHHRIRGENIQLHKPAKRRQQN